MFCSHLNWVRMISWCVDGATFRINKKSRKRVARQQEEAQNDNLSEREGKVKLWENLRRCGKWLQISLLTLKLIEVSSLIDCCDYSYSWVVLDFCVENRSDYENKNTNTNWQLMSTPKYFRFHSWWPWTSVSTKNCNFSWIQRQIFYVSFRIGYFRERESRTGEWSFSIQQQRKRVLVSDHSSRAGINIFFISYSSREENFFLSSLIY